MAKNRQHDLTKRIIRDINDTLYALRRAELIRDEQGVSEKVLTSDMVELTFSGKNSESNIVYDEHLGHKEMISRLLEQRQYVVLLYDKSIIQAEYTIQSDKLIKERLLFIKRHNKVWDKKEISSADADAVDWFEEEEGFPILIRVDYDPYCHRECEHASCHLSLSNSTTCRIPMKGPLSFSEFMCFLLMHFYMEKVELHPWSFGYSAITDLEKEMIHINW